MEWNKILFSKMQSFNGSPWKNKRAHKSKVNIAGIFSSFPRQLISNSKQAAVLMEKLWKKQLFWAAAATATLQRPQ